MTQQPLHRLVRQLLLAKTEDLDTRALAAYLDGWSSALSLLRRTEVCLPGASSEVERAVHAMLDEIAQAQAAVLDD